MSGPFKQVRTSQPQVPVGVDWGNPLTDELVLLHTGDSACYPLNANSWSLVNSPMNVTTVAGIGVGVSTNKYFYNNVLPPILTMPYTVLVMVVPNDVTSTGGIWTAWNSTGISGGHWIYVNTGKWAMVANGLGGTDNKISPATNAFIGTPSVVAAKFISDTDRHLWVNGMWQVQGTTNYYSSLPYVKNSFGAIANGGTTSFFNGTILVRAAWRRALSDQEMTSIGRNPWQLFAPQERQIWVSAGGTGGHLVVDAVDVYTHPSSDISITGWVPSTGTDLFACIDEASYDDADYITSPTVGTGSPATLGLSQSLAIGTWSVQVRVKKSGSTGQVRIHLVDSSDTIQGSSGWQSLSGSFSTYTFSITTTDITTRVRIEVQA